MEKEADTITLKEYLDALKSFVDKFGGDSATQEVETEDGYKITVTVERLNANPNGTTPQG